MQVIGIRQLQQHASAVIRDVKAGASIEVTERGRVVARIIPAAAASRFAQLVAEGMVQGDGRGLAEDIASEPPVQPRARAPLPSEVLSELRAHER